ncbi:unnamed protein product [Acanthocheilonema viteae]|uniref:F-box domain-containing protein n=1 Tax=Acanthocheilonema viteae TaxID=6277 RepID=A0A498SQA4_ACAVI|nr:unnamed protein product [Acanthocheilonema viteae]
MAFVDALRFYTVTLQFLDHLPDPTVLNKESIPLFLFFHDLVNMRHPEWNIRGTVVPILSRQRKCQHRILMSREVLQDCLTTKMSAFQDDLNGRNIIQNESRGLLSLLDETIIRIIEKLSSEDIANIADTCLRLREVVRKMTADGENSSHFSIESIDELDCTCE